MKPNEIATAMNTFISLYPSYYKNTSYEALQAISKTWEKRFAEIDDVNLFIEALYEYDRTSDYPSPPTTKQIIELYKKLKNRKETKENGKYLRIETPEEVLYQEYLALMKVTPKTPEIFEKLEKLKPYAMLFSGDGWEERYKRHFNTTKERKDYEKLY